jgi:hypothetical protein
VKLRVQAHEQGLPAYAPVSPSFALGTRAYGERRWKSVDILWILLIVILVLALLGFFSRGYW